MVAGVATPCKTDPASCLEKTRASFHECRILQVNSNGSENRFIVLQDITHLQQLPRVFCSNCKLKKDLSLKSVLCDRNYRYCNVCYVNVIRLQLVNSYMQKSITCLKLLCAVAFRVLTSLKKLQLNGLFGDRSVQTVFAFYSLMIRYSLVYKIVIKTVQTPVGRTNKINLLSLALIVR